MNFPSSKAVLSLFICCICMAALGQPAWAQKKKKKEKKSFLYVEPTKQEIEGEYLDALKEKILGNTKTSLALFAAFIKNHPEIAAGHFEFAELSRVNGIYSQALPAYQKAVILEPSNKWYKVGLAELYDFLKMYKEAKEVYKKLAEEYPKEIEFALSAAGILVQEGKLSEALVYLDKIEQQIGVTKEINMEKYRLLMAQKKYPEALKELEKLQNTYPGESLYLGMAAEVYHAKGDKKKALETYQKILQNDSSNTLIHLAIADYYQKENELNKAFFHLEKAFSNKEVSIDKKVMILLSFLEQSTKSEVHKQEGEKLTRLITEIHAEDPKSWSIRGDYLLGDARWRDALAAFQQVIQLDPSRFIFFRECAVLCVRLEDLKTLKNVLDKAEELYPLQPEVFLYRGIYYYQQKKLGDSEEQINYGKELIVDNPVQASQFMAMSAVLAGEKNDFATAQNGFQKAMNTDASGSFAKLEYTRYLNRTAAYELALSAADSYIKLAAFVPEGYAEKAKALFKLNRTDEAEASIEKALKLGGTEIKSILLLAAEIAEKKGNSEKANQYRTSAQSIN
ncbi:MAG: tetratricopeptide repeat protein [Flavobacteriales bacterium]|nr:tetratricopeptide repeat protein [Flavobacteriales bacterium]